MTSSSLSGIEYQYVVGIEPAIIWHYEREKDTCFSKISPTLDKQGGLSYQIVYMLESFILKYSFMLSEMLSLPLSMAFSQICIEK